jgi:hypothetical protein
VAATAIQSTWTWNSSPRASPAFTETTTITHLSVLGTTITLPNPIPANDNLTGLGTLPLGRASSTCGDAPTIAATPVAPGKGTGIGLGLLALVGGSTAIVYAKRRRHALA